MVMEGIAFPIVLQKCVAPKFRIVHKAEKMQAKEKLYYVGGNVSSHQLGAKNSSVFLLIFFSQATTYCLFHI